MFREYDFLGLNYSVGLGGGSVSKIAHRGEDLCLETPTHVKSDWVACVCNLRVAMETWGSGDGRIPGSL